MELAIQRPIASDERVCELCMIKKTKCNRQKPTCSRCAENGRTCTYTTKKRRPGPAKGSTVNRRRLSRSRDNRSQENTTIPAPAVTGSQEHNVRSIYVQSPLPEAGFSASYEGGSNGRQSPSASSWRGYRMIDIQSEKSADSLPEAQWSLSREAELDLLEVYFESIQPFYPLFRKQDLFHSYDTGQVPQSVLAAIFAVSAALSENPEIMMRGSDTIGEHYASLTRQACLPLCISDAPATIGGLRALFLLALYELRTSPNRRAWSASGHLVRLSYHYGLHQIDNLENCSFYEPGVTTSIELESWRYLWWSIYLLDTCCNSAAATPSNIDLDSLCTALPAGSIDNWTSGKETPSMTRHFLHCDIEDLSVTLKGISSKWLGNHEEEPDVDINFAIRIITASQIREVFYLRRAANQNPAGKFQQKYKMLLNHLAAARLAMPAKYLDPQRKVSLGERKSDHAIRLINLLEIKLSQLPVAMPGSITKCNENHAWLANWDTSIELVDDIVQIVRNWSPSMYSLADPAVCYIIFIAIILLHIDSKLEGLRPKTPQAEETSRSALQLLQLFLQQLGNQWLLPRALIVAAEKFQDTASTPISLSDASHIMQSLQRPLNFRPRLEGQVHDLDVDYSMIFPQPFLLDGSDSLHNWFSTFDHGEMTFA